ncbi:MAG: ABC transporter substrate-binding protein [Cyanothece sp. SIO1E1]|nr:ABC transporter substrate-binding protein [Cyanothece sp. SIO1E1]
MGRVAILRFQGELKRGLQVTFEWGAQHGPLEGRMLGSLAANPEIGQLYADWQVTYRRLEELYRRPRLELDREGESSKEECDRLATALSKHLNTWLDSTSTTFQRVSRQLAAELSHPEASQVLIQTNDPQLQRLPWHLWHFWQHHGAVEIILSPLEYQRIQLTPSKDKIRVLAILGNSQEINIEIDRQLLQQVPGIDPSSCFLEQPTRLELAEKLRDTGGWDILFFAGHSHSERESQTGRIYLNESESLTIDELPKTLKAAIENGLKLAIFNSCDGLGLANVLVDLQIPQTIIMREPVPDEVAHKFLEFFLQEFSQGAMLSTSVKKARERLESIQDQLPYATWLPIIYQHPIAPSLVWHPPSETFFLRLSRLRHRVIPWLGLAAAAVTFAGLYNIATAPLLLGDQRSTGEEILDTTAAPRLKQRAVKLVADCQVPLRHYLAIFNRGMRQKWQDCVFTNANYQRAVDLFYESWQEDGRDPETLIYLNNTFLSAQKADYYTIAVVVPLLRNEHGTVKDSALAQEILRGVAQAQTEINLGLLEANALPARLLPGQDFLPTQAFKSGKGLKVIIADDANLAEEAKQRAQALVKQRNILGVVGHYASETTMATVDIYDNHQLVLVSPGSTTQELTDPPRPFFFRTVQTTGVEAASLVDYLVQVKQRKAAVFYNPESPFTESFWREFKTLFKSQVGEGIEKFDLSAPNFNAEQALAHIQPDPETAIVLIPDGQVTNALANAIDIIEANNGRNLIVGSWGIYSAKTLAIAQLKPLQQLVVATPWHYLNSPNPKFSQSAQKLWGGPISTRTAPAYDAARVLIKALATRDRPTRIGVQKALAAPEFSVFGATGKIQFEAANGNRKHSPQELVQVIPCKSQQYGLAFVPHKLLTAKLASLSCH